MEKNKVSIITTTYNSEKTIARTVDSVLSQDYSPLEYIIIDNASTDNTTSIIENYRSQFKAGNSMFLVSEPDKGIYDGMNKGIRLASGDLVGIINSDDWYEKGAINEAVKAYKKNPDAVIYGMLRLYKKGKLYQVRQNTHEFVNENMFQHPTWFVPRKIYEQHGIFDVSYRIGGDYEFANRLVSKGVKFVRLEKILANFTMEGASSKTSVGGREWLKIKLKYGHISSEDYNRITQKKSDPTNARYHLKAFIKKLIQFKI